MMFLKKKISDTLKIHMPYSNALQTRYVFDFLQVFKVAKSEVIGQKFKGYSLRYLSKMTHIFTTEKKQQRKKEKYQIP